MRTIIDNDIVRGGLGLYALQGAQIVYIANYNLYRFMGVLKCIAFFIYITSNDNLSLIEEFSPDIKRTTILDAYF